MVIKKKADPHLEIKKKVQEWLPVIDIQKSMIVTHDSLVGALRVQPLNIALKSKNEIRSILQGLTGSYNGLLDNLQILVLPRPVDLDNYIGVFENLTREQSNLLKRKLINQYLNYVRELIASGEATEKRFYVLMSEKKGKYALVDLGKKLEILEESFIDTGLTVSRCSDRELTDLLFTFANSSVSAFEREPDELNSIFYNITYNGVG